jgi:NADPH-dependent 2,4-dienoyl-CoA reductase/sulfur reductase-like enzyme
MDKTDVLIVGGSASGVVTALTARRYHKGAQITLIRREKQVLVPCGIPYIFGTISSPERNLIPDTLLSKNDVDLIIDEVNSLEPAKKTITTLGGTTFRYEKLVLATGSTPIVPPIPGVELKNVFMPKKDIDYLKALSKALEDANDVVIVGGGLVGIEFADEFRKKGLNVTIVELLPHCLQLVFDEEFCSLAEKKLSERGVKIRTNTRIEGIVGREEAEGVRLNTGEELRADIVFIAIGVIPNIRIAQEAGLRIGPHKAVWVDEYQRTSDENVFAVGDCAEKKSFFTGNPVALRLASIATREARIAAENLYRLNRRNEGAIGAFSTVIGDFSMGAVGLTEKMARDFKYEPVVGVAMAPDKHPASMPNTSEMKVKLVFDKATGQILGGQVYGGLTTGEVVNILASMIQKRMTVDEVLNFQMGTHPALTASPISYPIVSAAEDAKSKLIMAGS